MRIVKQTHTGEIARACSLTVDTRLTLSVASRDPPSTFWSFSHRPEYPPSWCFFGKCCESREATCNVWVWFNKPFDLTSRLGPSFNCQVGGRCATQDSDFTLNTCYHSSTILNSYITYCSTSFMSYVIGMKCMVDDLYIQVRRTSTR